MAIFNNPRKTAATATGSATLARGTHTPVNATSGALIMTLPTNAPAGVEISVEKVDSSANAVTVSGTIRGALSSIPLTSQYESRTFLSEGVGSWRPISDHRTASSLSASYQYPRATRVNASNPTGTVSTTLVMAGLAVPFTSQSTGKVMITITGTAASGVGPNNVGLAGRFGTGTAPANGVAVTGTAFSSNPTVTVRPPIASTGGITPFTLQDVVSGLTVGTAYWFDVAFLSGSATATANLNNLVFILAEVS